MLESFGIFTFVANQIAFCATCSIRFSVFLSTIACTPLNLTFNLTLIISMVFLDLAVVACCVGADAFSRFFVVLVTWVLTRGV